LGYSFSFFWFVFFVFAFKKKENEQAFNISIMGLQPKPAFISFDAKETKQRKACPELRFLYFYPAKE